MVVPPSFVVGCPPSIISVPAARSAPGIHPASSGSQVCWQGLVLSFVVVLSWGGSGFHRWLLVVVPLVGHGGSPLVVVPYVYRGLSPLICLSWWFPLCSSWVVTLHSSWGCPVHLSWWSPLFVMCGPPLDCCRWCAVSTHDPPCEQWLAGLGTGAGSFICTHPASRGSQRWWWWWWWVVIVVVRPLVVTWQPAAESSGSQSSPPFRPRSTP
jgi:uncharacterized membrane protein YuzA (DUF378 family)